MPITSIRERAGRNYSREGGEGPGNQAALPLPLHPELEEGEARKKMAAVAAEAAATAASPGEGGAGEAEPEMEPIPGSEAGTDPLPVTATEASVPDGEADGQQSSPQADEPPLPPPPPPPGELARSPEAAGPELEAEEKLPARVAEPAAAAPQERPDLPPSPAPPPEQPPAPEERQEPPLPQPAAPALVPPAGGDSAVSQLIPGSEVRVTLDHIIEDALVVSFRLGEKLFSGVLMDLSKRYRASPQHVPWPPLVPREGASWRARTAPAPRALAACKPSGPVRRGARASRGGRRARPGEGGLRPRCARVKAGVLPGGGRGCLTRWQSAAHTPGLFPRPGPGAPTPVAWWVNAKCSTFAENLVLGGGHCLLARHFFFVNSPLAGLEKGVCAFGFPKG